MSNPVLDIIIADLKAAGAALEKFAETAGQEIWNVIQAVFKAEEQVIMAQLFTMLKNDAVSLQNSQPGISSKDMEGALKTNAETALASLGVNLAYTAVITTIGTVMHDLQVPDNTGNAGQVS